MDRVSPSHPSLRIAPTKSSNNRLYSIEGSTIIIACSIPILQPLLEKILHRNPFASSGKPSKPSGRYYEEYSDARSGYELGERKAPKKPKDDLGLTIIPDGSSEEGILSPADGYQQQQQTAYVVGVADDRSAGDGQMRPPSARGQDVAAEKGGKGMTGKIMRTDTVTVSYDEEAQTGSRRARRTASITSQANR